MVAGIPAALDSDAEDVAWALQTADALWKRHERVDAIVWLRRAAQAAGEAEDDDRALALARIAAELTEWVAHHGNETVAPPPASEQPVSVSSIDDLLRASQVDMEVAPDVLADQPGSPVGAAPRGDDEAGGPFPDRLAAPPPPAPTLDLAPPPSSPPQAVVVSHEPHPEPETVSLAPEDAVSILPDARPPKPPPPVSSPPARPPVPTGPPAPSARLGAPPPLARHAADVHAGLLDPWAEESAKRGFGDAPDEDRAQADSSPDSVVTSAPPMPSSPPRRPATAPRPPPPRPPPRPAYPTSPDVVTSASRQGRRDPDSSGRVPVAPSEPIVAPVPAAPPPPSRSSGRLPAAPPNPSPPAPSTQLDLAFVEAFADLPDDARSAFAACAAVHDLTRDTELRGFALALVLAGTVDLASTILDAPAESLGEGAVVRARGTLEDPLPLRLICSGESARVATWEDAAVVEAFRSCPWVEDDLRAAGDRRQALVGATMGPLGERLDTALRASITERLAVRVLLGGDVLVEEGNPIPGLVIVGAGELELGDGVLGAGEFLFPGDVFAARPAPATVRASAGGAVLLFADRHLAQELAVTCPPLLDLFAT